MATTDDDDFEGPPTRPQPSPHDVVERTLADLVLQMRGLADELHELREALRKTGVTPQIRAAVGGALRRLRSQVGFAAETVDPPPVRRPNARRVVKAKRS